jgi:hypothetical protein
LGHISLDRGDIFADFGFCLIQFCLAAARDEDISALLHK